MNNKKIIKDHYHHGDLQNALIEETIKIIAESGVQNVTLRALSKRLGVSRTAPYRHFSDKTQLLTRVAIVGFERFRAYLQIEPQQQTNNVLERFHQMGRNYIQFAQQNPAYYKLMFSEPMLAKERSSELESASDASFKQLLNILEECQKAGLLKNQSTELQAIFIWSNLHGFCSLILEGHLPLDKQQQDAIYTFIEETILQGIAQTNS